MDGRYTDASHMPGYSSSVQPKLDNVLVATDFSPASKTAVLYATSIARRHSSKLLLAHVVSSRSENVLMDGWRVGQMENWSVLISS